MPTRITIRTSSHSINARTSFPIITENETQTLDEKKTKKQTESVMAKI